MSKQETSLRAIAKAMGRSHTTLSRELQRNTGRLGYRYQQAQHLAEHRHQEKKPKAVKLTETVSAYIQGKLQAWWTQEKIRGQLRLEQAISISPETVYRFVLNDKHQGASSLVAYATKQSLIGNAMAPRIILELSQAEWIVRIVLPWYPP